MFNEDINQLINYGINNNLIEKEDSNYIANLLIGLFEEDEYIQNFEVRNEKLENILKSLVEYAIFKGIIKDTLVNRDSFDTKIMNTILDRPSNIIKKFNNLYSISPKKATDFYYNLSLKSNYIREDRIKKDIKWKVNTKYGEFYLTINLSKPEKDPKDILETSKKVSENYPKCYICRENEGFKGNIDYPSKENLRIIPIKIKDKKWYIQYSPYVYYNEHSIIFSEEHEPMKVKGNTFENLFDFIEKFPHYFIGSNAGIPIVGGSILNHLHYQGGRYDFPIFTAEAKEEFAVKKFKNIKCEILNWPMTVIKLSSENYVELIELGKNILEIWENYTDEKVNIFSKTVEGRHNTVTPIARKNGGKYELYIALRNNITTKERPMGYFHPREKYHNIKKENIGLIEVMGLAVLPGRLKKEIEIIKEYIIKEKIADSNIIEKHKNIIIDLKENTNITLKNIDLLIKENIGCKFSELLEEASVFKNTKEGREAIIKFINKIKQININ
ncbi:UDP-glucose--hexose-1-phosphate uridylyltransferase [Miniphocaeibacter massiliensis]|uniref:UDP-glucose--hexose-1-phosphate uridylyltransferase n=1 Tax=Miniphocaeibacter massiliensis TaxID=2041841 RepID=UPI000C1BF92D|nr:UDP-glucose--hexose-1-phosphate uridylyltransferase [Miniphocaeibacter massiliensis]